MGVNVPKPFRALSVLALALALGACSSGAGLFGGGQAQAPAAPPSPGASTPSVAHTTLFGQPIQQGQIAFNPDLCPRIEVRDGSNVWRQGGPGPSDVRYQATITDLARECRMEGGNLVIRVGVEGRVVVGPRGGAGAVSLPIRIAMTRGLAEPLWTRLYQAPIQIPANTPNVAFTQIEDNLSIPLPDPGDARVMVIFVGFDNLAGQRPEGRGRPRG